MTDPTEDLNPPAVLEQPGWKPRHRVDPMRPANPHKPPTGEYEYDTIGPDPHYYGQHRKDRSGPNLTIGLVLLVIAFLVAGFLSWVALSFYGSWTS